MTKEKRKPMSDEDKATAISNLILSLLGMVINVYLVYYIFKWNTVLPDISLQDAFLFEMLFTHLTDTGTYIKPFDKLLEAVVSKYELLNTRLIYNIGVELTLFILSALVHYL